MDTQTFEYTFPDGSIRLPSGSKHVTVVAEKTKTDALIVTPFDPITRLTSARGKKFVITHAPTGMKVVPNGVRLSRRVARLVAGALGGVCDWNQTNALAIAEALRSAGLYKWLREEVGQ